MNSSIDPRSLIKHRYGMHRVVRDEYLNRSFEYAAVTIPSVMPDRAVSGAGSSNNTQSQEFQHDYNTEGAKLVNNLANYYIQTLFPAGRTFVKLRLDEPDLAAQEAAGRNKGTIETTFAAVERDLRQRFEDSGSRDAMLDLLKHLIITGNGLWYKPKTGNTQLYALDEYVAHSSLDGFLNEVITEDRKSVAALPDDIREGVITELNLKPEALETVTCTLYTQVIRRGIDPALTSDEQRVRPMDWTVRQSVESYPVGDPYELPRDKMRWHPQVWERTRREPYGRGLVETHFGSFWVLSILTEALTLGAVTMGDIKYLVRPGSLIDVAQLNASASGTYHYGEADDVTTVEKKLDREFKLVADVIESYKRHLGEVFMHLPSQLRDAERVTAEENHLRAMSLEKSHGGVFSQLAKNLQEPMARLFLEEMDVTGLRETNVKIAVVTGFDALARGQENEKILLWLRDLSAVRELPEQVLQRLDWNSFMQTTAAGRDVDFSAIILSEDRFAKLQAEAQKRQQSEATQQALLKKANPQQVAAGLNP